MTRAEELINDYVRITRRSIVNGYFKRDCKPQRTKLQNQLADEIYNNIVNTKTDKFSFENYYETSEGIMIQARIKFLQETISFRAEYKPEKFQDFIADMLRSGEYNLCGTLRNRNDSILNVQSNLSRMNLVINTYKELEATLNKIKQASALQLLQYNNTPKRGKQRYEALVKRNDIRRSLKNEIQQIWEAENPMVPGMPIRYWDAFGHDKYGVIVEVLDRDFRIKSDAGKTVTRSKGNTRRHSFSDFWNSDIGKNIQECEKGIIPESWQGLGLI